MLDWPEATHTSPAQTSPNVTVFVPLILSVYGPPAGSAGSAIDQRPAASALAVAFAAAMVAVTASSGAAVPASRSGRSRWTTM